MKLHFLAVLLAAAAVAACGVDSTPQGSGSTTAAKPAQAGQPAPAPEKALEGEKKAD